MSDPQTLIGLWCVSGGGAIGCVEQVSSTYHGPRYTGTRIDGTSWCSYVPSVLGEAEQQALRAATSSRVLAVA